MVKVLIVEDDPMVAMINEKYVNRNKQFHVIAKCKNGSAALKYMDENDVDLVIMDVYMPVMNGIETLRAMREKGLLIPAIMVTAANDIPTLEQALSLGAVDYLVKPFAFDRFQVALEKYLMYIDTIKGSTTLNQQKIDSILGGASQQAEDSGAKGIQKKTMETILDYMRTRPGEWMSADEITEHVGISSVTIRRYMNYMSENGTVEKQINYGTGGRPSALYRV